MSLALKQNDSKAVLKKVSQLSISRILEAQEQYKNAQFELMSAKNSLKFLESNKDVKGRKQAIKACQDKIAECEAAVAGTPHLPLLVELRRMNEDELTDTLQLMIIDVVKFHHTTDKMAKEQIFETAWMIMNTFAGLTLEDVGLCFYQAKSGGFGEVYNRVDGAVIIDWLHKYQDKMRSIGMERELQKHLSGKGETYKRGGDYRIVEPKKFKDLL